MSKQTASLWFWRFFALAGLGLLFWGGFRENPIPQYSHDFDKIIHVTGFTIVTVACLMAFTLNVWVIIPVLLMLLGLSIEIGQGWFLPMRSFDWEDFRMDVIGILLGVALIMPFRYWSIQPKASS
ncbi:VanZ family protein [Aestuariicella sp. G3-2]|uniref:VanZ family protein n=1 Tax=Pseudomaricurvus albidus TaxID=2842452 RepID=UPI001C0DDF90|nr:VanZ family protein [Aestuariicella albida]